ncbi:ABC transporter substrate-binding protein [Actibacterium pelagium]|uniref:Branched-chain amino acid ABC transporter substrate-binding protein n=1 Tax=Actibacterium pelagium TaxID=2029103 RepID=A0A917AAT2_9RHOB|nr:ABC transporter substrate-binding protein [Actibacterium pelagium]GGE37824.1 branched-chain amino acid ABC transporter substrate-binding protein [Actibacterium pelagium]
MRKLLLATTAAITTAGAAMAGGHMKDVTIGVLVAFTGPLESLAPPIAEGAELAIKEVNDSGKFVDGGVITPVRGDSTCVDAGAATAAAERLITAEGASAIMGAMCSGATGAVFTNVSRPNGILQISPSATSPGLTALEDDNLFFRLAPSDARQGEVMTDVIMDKGFKEVALTYTNNDYGKGLADSFQSAFEAAGGTVTISAAHEDGKSDYSAEVGALASAGGEVLVVAGYADQGGAGVIQAALDSGAFDTFVLPDGMVTSALTDRFGADLDGSFGQNPSASGDAAASYEQMAEAAGFDGSSPYAKEGYDSAALIMLAMHATGSTEGKVLAEKVWELANGPGEKIYPGELGKAMEILSAGGAIDYEGASSVNLIGPGEASGSYREIVVEGGEIKEVGFR